MLPKEINNATAEAMNPTHRAPRCWARTRQVGHALLIDYDQGIAGFRLTASPAGK
jgi:hypothetical protein